MPRMNTVPTALSDLFFNTDLSEAKERDDKGKFIGFNDTKLTEIGTTFLASIEQLGVQTPPIDHLIEDFYARI